MPVHSAFSRLCHTKSMRQIKLFISTLVLIASSVQAMDLRDWKERSFDGNTDYSHDGTAIRGETRGTASVLYKEEKIDLSKTPVVNWRWKISNTYGTEHNEQSKSGDDYPARLYVVVKTGFLPWQTLALNYVWSSNQPVGTSWKNAFTDKAVMVVLDSGEENLNLWQSHSRNVIEDFKTYFGEEVDTLDGYAIMVDGDNTGQSATAWFDAIEFTGE